MAIDDIFRALQEQGEREIADVLDTAREQSKGIVDDANAQAGLIRASKTEAAQEAVESRTARVINAARLDARRVVAGVKERAIAGAFDQALVELDGLRSSPGYPALFAALAAEALDGLEGEVALLVDPADEALAASALAASGLSGTVDATVPTRGGLTVVAQDNTMYRRNTVEDRLEKYRSSGQTAVAELLLA